MSGLKLQNLLKKSINATASETIINNTPNIELIEGKVVKWFLGINVIECELLDNQLIRVKLLNNYISKDLIIKHYPVGEINQEDEYYIELDELLFASVLRVGEEYVCLGFNSKNNQDTASRGEIIIKSGSNKISINKDRINIISNNIMINGKSQDDYYTKQEVDELLKKENGN